jgi:Cys-tRNA(Pro)/Cys-tRNA(Cys) deacylase
MTPAINSAKKAKIPYTVHSYDHDPTATSYGEEAAQKLGLDPQRVFKTLVAQTDDQALVVAVVPVATTLNLKQLARAMGAKRAEMADKAAVERVTGYVIGGVSPLGQKRRLTTVIDSSAEHFPTIFVSAGKRGLDLELRPADLAKLTGAGFFAIGERR